MRSALWLLLSLWMVLSVVAAGASPPIRPLSEPELSATVELHAVREPLTSVLAKISAATRMRFRAVGKAADLRVTAIIRKASARSVLTRLATLLNLSWDPRRGDHGLEYVLHESDLNLAAITRERVSERTRLVAQARRLLQGAVDPRILGDTPADRAVRDQLSQPEIAAAARFIGLLPEPVLAQMQKGQPVTVPLAQLSSQATSALREQRWAAALTRQAIGRDLADIKGQPAPALTPPGELQAAVVQVAFDRGLSLQVFDGGKSVGGISLPVRELSFDDRLQAQRHFASRECAIQRPPLERLLGRLDWESALERWSQLQQADILAEALDPSVELTLQPVNWAHLREQGAPEVLDLLCFTYEAEWNAETEPVILRRAAWHRLREEQVTPRSEAAWRRLTEEKKPYLMSQLAEMAAMPPTIGSMLARYGGPDAARAASPTLRDILLFYALLRPEQQRQAETSSLPLGRLDLAQKNRISEIIAMVRPGRLTLPQSFDRLEISSAPAEYVSTITLHFRDGFQHSFRIGTRAEARPKPWGTRSPTL
jgi:hypothetical protein